MCDALLALLKAALELMSHLKPGGMCPTEAQLLCTLAAYVHRR